MRNAETRRIIQSVNKPLLVATASILLLVIGWATSGFPVTATFQTTQSTVVFNFDTGSPPPSLYQNTPFNYLSSGVTARFSSPSDPIATAFSVQDTVPVGYNMSTFSGQWLYDNHPTRDYLDIKFNWHLYNISLTFTIIEPHGGPGVLPSYINLTAYMDSVGSTPVGWTWARGDTASEQNTLGTLAFDSGGQPFNLVRIWIPQNQPPFNPTDFFVDNIVITASPAPDNTPPVTTINLTGTLGNLGWYKSNVGVTLSATDDISGVNKTEYSFNNVTWTTYTTPFTVSTEGTTTVYYKSTDNVGNAEAIKTQTVKIDKTLPTGSILINNGDASTNSRFVTLTLTQTDAVSGVSQVRYSNDGVWNTEPWEAPSPTKAWTLTAGDGTKTVYYQVIDNAGWISLTYQDSIILTETVAHDVAVTNVASSKTVVGQSYPAPVNVTVQNQGGSAETFTLTAYADLSLPTGDEITIEAKTVANLLAGESRSVLLTWNTSLITPKGNYTISAYASVVAGETDTMDNTFVGGILKVATVGDMDANGKVDIKDLAKMAKDYGAVYPNPNYHCDCDINYDGKIDIKDLAIAAKKYGIIDP